MGHLWHQYWSWVGGNVGAMPLQAAITVAATLLLRKPVSRLWHHVVGEAAGIEDIRRAALAAHKIAADLHEKLTGEAHPDAPAHDTESGGK